MIWRDRPIQSPDAEYNSALPGDVALGHLKALEFPVASVLGNETAIVLHFIKINIL